jgi:hypothetical protein
MKISKCTVVMLIVISALLMTITTASAVPPLPSSFYGTVKVNGENVAVGVSVTATINGVQYAYAATQLYQGDTVYTLDVPGDDLGTTIIEGGVSGDTVVFKVNGITALETGTWQSGTNIKLNLTIDSLPMLYLPITFK